MPAKKNAGFRLNGNPLQRSAPTPGQRRILKILDALPFGDLLDTGELAARTGQSVDALCSMARTSHLENYRERFKLKHIWGNPKTIAALRKELSSNSHETC